MADATDAELVSKTRGGCSEAYGPLVARYQGHVYGLAFSLAGNWADAQDIAQETFIRAYVNLDRLRDPARFAPWLRRVTFGVAMNWLKSFRPGLFEHLDGRVDLETLEIPDFQPGPPEVVERRELAEAVLGAIASLPPKYRVPLTMFHLDGLSYQKVADFLDIPLGTVKTLIHRARGKLKVALAAYVAGEVSPVVAEVFNEHKLPAEFVRKVLDTVPQLEWGKGETTFAGAVVACLQSLGDDVSYALVMGASGGAFKLFWFPKWCAGNGDLLPLGEEPVSRAFRALGYRYRFLAKTGAPGESEEFRRQVIESIERGRPVIASGLGGPESSLVAGYDNGGDVVLGYNYFRDASEGHYRETDWYQKCGGLIVIGDKVAPPPERKTLRDALQWAVDLARVPERVGRASGLAAYDAWAKALERDEDFPEGDLETLTYRCLVNADATASTLRDARQHAVEFLRSMAAGDRPGDPELLEAALAYEEEISILRKVLKLAPFYFAPEDERLKMADPARRRRIAQLVRAAKDVDQRAVEHLERALREVGA